MHVWTLCTRLSSPHMRAWEWGSPKQYWYISLAREVVMWWGRIIQEDWDIYIFSSFSSFIFSPFSSSSVVTIGFDATSYTITESTTSVSVSVSVQGSTTLARDVVLTVETMDGTATGGALWHTQTLYTCHSHFIISPSSFIWLHNCVHGPDIQCWHYKPNCDDTHHWWYCGGEYRVFHCVSDDRGQCCHFEPINHYCHHWGWW